MDIEVEPGEGGQKGEDIGADPQTLIDPKEDPGTDKGRHGMSGREGEIWRAGEEQVDSLTDMTGASPVNEVFEQEIAEDIIGYETASEHQTSFSAFRDQQEQQGQTDPDRPLVAEQTDEEQRVVKQFASEIKPDGI